MSTSPASRSFSPIRTFVWAIASLTIATIGRAATAQTYERTVLPHFGGNITTPSAVNNSGVVVGSSVEANFSVRAFRSMNGSFEMLTIPGSTSVANGINDAGKIVGYAVNGSDTQGFVWENGAVSFLPGIGGIDTIASAINGNDIVVGAAADAGGVFRPVRWQRVSGNWVVQPLVQNNPPEGEAIAINNVGTIVGTVKNAMGEQRAFSWTSGGGLVELPTLGGNRGLANDINSAGVIAGSARDMSGQLKPCLWTNGTPAALPTFGGTTGDAFAISDQGVVVGAAASSNGFTYAAIWTNGQIDSIYSTSDEGSAAIDLADASTIVGTTPGVGAGGVVWTRTGTVYEAIDLGTFGGGETSNAFDVNDLGEVVGVADAPNFTSRGFLWQDGALTEIGTFGGTTSIAFGINNSSQITGYATQANSQRRAFRWENGTLTNLGTLGGIGSTGLGINNAGIVVGHSFDAQNMQQAFVWQNNVMTQLPNLGGAITEAVAINDDNVIVGSSSNSQGAVRSVRWMFNGSNWVIETLSGINSTFNKALGIGEDGTIVGQYLDSGSGEVRAYSWFNFQMTDLGLITGTFSAAKGVGPSLIVGTGTSYGSDVHALGFVDDEIMNLNDRLRYSDDWVLNDARAINTKGWIIGSGQHGGTNRAFLLRPAVGGTPATPLSVQVAFGTHLGGGLNELLQSDNQYYRTRSRQGISALEPNLMEMRMTFDANVASADTFTLTIESRINHPTGAAKIRFRNYNTNQFQEVAQYTVVFAEGTETLNNLPATNFIRASDERVELSVKHIVIAVFSALGFDSSFDQITLESN